MPVTQKQIARESGVSQCVVSYVFNDDPRVTAATRERVLRAAQELGYDFAGNREAKVLVARRYGKRVRSGLIAIVLPTHHFAGTPAIQIPFYQEMLGGIETEAEARGSAVLLCSTHRPNLGSFLSSHRVDGVISLDDEASLHELFQTLDMPCCILGRGSEDVINITFDSRAGIALTTQHLIDLGHKAIGFVGFPENYYEGCVRADSYRATLLKNGIQPESRWCFTEGFTIEGFGKAVTTMMEQAPELTALVCFNDLVAMEVVKTIRKHELHIPADISIVGFDNVRHTYGDLLEITSVAYDRVAMGRRAVQRMYEEIDGSEALDQREIFPVQLAEHASSGTPRQNQYLSMRNL